MDRLQTIVRSAVVLVAVSSVVVGGCGRRDADQTEKRVGVAQGTESVRDTNAPPPQSPPLRVCSEMLQGNIGASAEYGSGWMDLAKITDFTRGDTLRIKVGGSAARVVVRLLPRDVSADSPTGIDGGIVTVSQGGRVEVVLQEDHGGVKQVSVHGGPNPWGLYDLGGGNGPATLLSVQRIYTCP